MELVNQSGLPLELTTAFDVSGREHLLIVAKATYHFDTEGGVAAAEQHVEVAFGDVFVGEPGSSAPRYEADTALRKARCDVIVDATARAPGQQPVTELEVGLQVGPMNKQLLAVGNRVWQKGALRVSASAPTKFTEMPLDYGRAFGGRVPQAKADGTMQYDTYEANPVGAGYSSDARANAVEGMPLPNVEDIGVRVSSPSDQVPPRSFGPVARGWAPRRDHAGSYGTRWHESERPLLPSDFDERFFQCAPPDQQIDFPTGGEQVGLRHLVADHPVVVFDLPAPELLVKVLHSSNRASELTAVVDTLFIEPDEMRFTYVYRASMPLDRRGVFGIQLVAAGPICDRWWSSKVFGTSDCGCGGNAADDIPEADEEVEDEAPQSGSSGDDASSTTGLYDL